MDWSAIRDTLSSFLDSGMLVNLAILITAIWALLQLGEMQRTTQAQSYSVAIGILQEEKVRKARQAVFQLGRKAKPIEKWTKMERQNVEMVCHTYDSVGQMVRYRLLRKKYIIDSWGPSIRNIWPIVSPMVYKYRKDWGAPETWDDFEWLFNEARNYDIRRRKRGIWMQRFSLFSKKKKT